MQTQNAQPVYSARATTLPIDCSRSRRRWSDCCQPSGEQPAAKSLVKQLERCGPAGGANYQEARGAERPSDFIHKVRSALKEVRETRYWLQLILRAELLDCPHTLAHLIDESGEPIAILTASAKTARSRTDRRTCR